MNAPTVSDFYLESMKAHGLRRMALVRTFSELGQVLGANVQISVYLKRGGYLLIVVRPRLRAWLLLGLLHVCVWWRARRVAARVIESLDVQLRAVVKVEA